MTALVEARVIRSVPPPDPEHAWGSAEVAARSYRTLTRAAAEAGVRLESRAAAMGAA